MRCEGARIREKMIEYSHLTSKEYMKLWETPQESWKQKNGIPQKFIFVKWRELIDSNTIIIQIKDLKREKIKRNNKQTYIFRKSSTERRKVESK